MTIFWIVKANVTWGSDEVEAGVFLLEAGVHGWWGMALASSLTDESSKPVSIPDDGRFLDGTTDIVVGEAELVGQRLEHVWRSTDCVVDHGVSSWSTHTLASCN